MSGSSRYLTYVAAATAAVGAGILPTLLSPVGSLLVCLTGLMVLSVVVLRRALPGGLDRGRRSSVEAVDTPAVPGAVIESAALRIARGFFYVGILIVGESSFRWVGGLTLSEACFIAAFAICVLATIRGNGHPTIPAPVLMAVGLFVFGATISSFDAQSPTSSAYQTLHAVYVLLLWPAVGVMVLRTRQQVTTALALWAVSSAIDGVAAIMQLAGLHVFGLATLGTRMTGFTAHANDLGGVMSVALVPALLIATRAIQPKRAVLRRLRYVPVALTATGLVLSGSISGMAAGGVALLVWLASPAVRAPARVAVAAAIVCALAVVAVSGGKVTSPAQRLTQVTSANPTGVNGSGQDRIAVARQAWPRIASNPFIGAGLDTSDSAVTIISHSQSVPYQIHGLPVAAWYETGIFGVVGIMGLLVVLGKIGLSGARAATSDDELLIGWALVAALIAFVIEAMTQAMVFQQYGWITAVMVVAWARRADAVSSASSTRDAGSELSLLRTERRHHRSPSKLGAAL
jgi:O-antigen ligase